MQMGGADARPDQELVTVSDRGPKGKLNPFQQELAKKMGKVRKAEAGRRGSQKVRKRSIALDKIVADSKRNKERATHQDWQRKKSIGMNDILGRQVGQQMNIDKPSLSKQMNKPQWSSSRRSGKPLSISKPFNLKVISKPFNVQGFDLKKGGDPLISRPFNLKKGVEALLPGDMVEMPNRDIVYRDFHDKKLKEIRLDPEVGQEVESDSESDSESDEE